MPLDVFLIKQRKSIMNSITSLTGQSIAAVTVSFVLGLTFPIAAQAEERATLKLTSHDMKVTGTSTLHDWESEVQKLEVEGSALLSTEGMPEVDKLTLEVPVNTIESGKRKMNNLTYEALEQKEHPLIRYELTELTFQEADKWLARGTLTIAGQSGPLEMDVQISENSSNALVVKGEPEIEMTDFGVSPPSLMFGAMKVGAEVQIPFEITLSLTE